MSEEKKNLENMKEKEKTQDAKEVKNEEIKTEEVKEVKAEESKIEETKKEEQPTKKSKSTFGKVLGIIGKTLGLAIIIFLIVIIVRAAAFKRYDVFGYRFYMIMSGSMEPNIKIGDAVIAKETNTKELKQQDVIAFAHNNGAVTVHRIINVYTEGDKKMYETQGDNNNTPDGQLVQEQDIKGIIVAKISNVGTAILFIQNHIYIFILVIVLIILAIIVRRLI